MKPSINIIGAGNLGKTISRLIVENEVGIIQGICNRSLASSKQAREFIGEGELYSTIEELPKANITLITTDDEQIQSCAKELAQSKNFKNKSVIAHCSGSLPSSILEPVRSKGCYIASVHPMRSFANPEISVREFTGTYCAMDGDEEAINILKTVFESIGSKTYTLASDKKSFYHAAGVFASNYLVSIYEAALSCLQKSGIDKEIVNNVIVNLMKGTIKNLEETKSAKLSLTGSIKRGDINTISKHIETLRATDLIDLYRALGLYTLNITDLDPQKNKKIKKLLQS